MKIQRISVLIPACENTHRRFLYNEVLDLARRERIGGEFKTDSIKLSSMPENLLKELEEKGIKFMRVG